MNEQELRDEFEKTNSKYFCVDFSRNEFGQYQGLENRVAFEYFKKGYSLAQETIEKHKNLYEASQDHMLKMRSDFHQLQETIKAKDAEIIATNKLFVEQIKLKNKTIAEARGLIDLLIYNPMSHDVERAKAWLDGNK